MSFIGHNSESVLSRNHSPFSSRVYQRIAPWGGCQQHVVACIISIWLLSFVKLAFKCQTVQRQHHSFSTHEQIFMWKSRSFWDRKYFDPMGTLTPNLRIHTEYSIHLSYWGRHFLISCFEKKKNGSNEIDIFVRKLAYCQYVYIVGPLLLTWFNFNPSMDK